MSAPEERALQVERGGDEEALRHLKESLAQGKHWYVALLEAIGLWSSPEEVYRGRRFRYLVSGEAFDWLLLAERLLAETKGQTPEQEVMDLLFSGKPPIDLPAEEFKRLIGPAKYRAYLNYLYGVILEEALLIAVEEEVQKERSIMGFEGSDVTEEAFKRLYGVSRGELLARFRKERSLPNSATITLSDLREFTYWLFKFRVATLDPERVASDTRKALNQVRRVGARYLNLNHPLGPE